VSAPDPEVRLGLGSFLPNCFLLFLAVLMRVRTSFLTEETISSVITPLPHQQIILNVLLGLPSGS
jgi:hypothetical protein